MAEILEVGYWHWRHPDDPNARTRLVDAKTRGVAGAVSNTSRILGGARLPDAMLSTAHSTIDRSDSATPKELCSTLLEDLHEMLEPFTEVTAPAGEAQRARWELGGSAAFVAARGSSICVGRVGDLRVIGLTGSGEQTRWTTLLREHPAGETLAPRGMFPYDEARPVAKISLTSPELPRDVCAEVPDETRWILVGTPEIFDHTSGYLVFGLERAPLNSAIEDWFKIAMAAWRWDRNSIRPPCSSALLIARVDTTRGGVLR